MLDRQKQCVSTRACIAQKMTGDFPGYHPGPIALSLCGNSLIVHYLRHPPRNWADEPVFGRARGCQRLLIIIPYDARSLKLQGAFVRILSNEWVLTGKSI
jgi:hypothetical protein